MSIDITVDLSNINIDIDKTKIEKELEEFHKYQNIEIKDIVDINISKIKEAAKDFLDIYRKSYNYVQTLVALEQRKQTLRHTYQYNKKGGKTGRYLELKDNKPPIDISRITELNLANEEYANALSLTSKLLKEEALKELWLASENFKKITNKAINQTMDIIVVTNFKKTGIKVIKITDKLEDFIKIGIDSDYSQLVAKVNVTQRKILEAENQMKHLGKIENGLEVIKPEEKDLKKIQDLNETYHTIQQRYNKHYNYWKEANNKRKYFWISTHGDIDETYVNFYMNLNFFTSKNGLRNRLEGYIYNFVNNRKVGLLQVDNASGDLIGDVSLENGSQLAVKGSKASLAITQGLVQLAKDILNSDNNIQEIEKIIRKKKKFDEAKKITRNYIVKDLKEEAKVNLSYAHSLD